MLSLKKTAIAVLALGSSTVFAGGMGPVCTPGSVTVPCEATAWDVGLYAMYLKPTVDADWGYVGTYVNNNHTTYRDFEYDYGWGFKLDGSYHFSTGNDFTVSWYHFDDKTTNHDLIGTVAAPFTERNTIKTKWDAVNFEFGQHVDFGEHKNIRFHGGAQYATIKKTWDHNNNGNAIVSYYQSKFNGFGPRAGADMSYDFGSGFEMYANAAGAILVGTSKFNTWSSPAAATTSGSKDSVVPEMEAKLGAKYNYAMAQGVLTLDAGWMFTNYFNALHVVATGLGETDVAFNGPVFGLKWVGNA